MNEELLIEVKGRRGLNKDKRKKGVKKKGPQRNVFSDLPDHIRWWQRYSLCIQWNMHNHWTQLVSLCFCSFVYCVCVCIFVCSAFESHSSEQARCNKTASWNGGFIHQGSTDVRTDQEAGETWKPKSEIKRFQMMTFSGGMSRPRTAQNSKVGGGRMGWDRNKQRWKRRRDGPNKQLNQSRERGGVGGTKRQKTARRTMWAIK